MTPGEFRRVFALPFSEAAGFFRAKLSLPTEKWDDLWRDEQAKGFMSAGAMDAGLLTDLRQMVDEAIAGDMTIADFKKAFPDLVEKYGWELKGGGPGWRADLIVRTNINSAYQAGRWSQFEDAGVTHLKYVHMDGVINPRPEHAALNGTVLPVDDPFWAVNYPPNGFGCHCRAVAATPEEIEAATGERPKNWEKAADPGWDYNVGVAGKEEGYAALTKKFESLPGDIARTWMGKFVMEPAFDLFIAGKIKGEFPVAVIKDKDMAALGTDKQAVWLSAETLAEHLARHPEIGLDDYRLIPEIVDEGEVYRQTDGRLIVLRNGNTYYRLALKTTMSRDRNYTLTLFKTNDAAALREVIRRLERIR